MEYGSLVNLIKSQTISPDPEVGMGATKIMWTDRYPYTVIEVSESKKRCKVQEDKAIRKDSNGMSDCQEYSYERNENGVTYELSLRKNGQWKEVGGDQLFQLGKREKYHDFSF